MLAANNDKRLTAEAIEEQAQRVPELLLALACVFGLITNPPWEDNGIILTGQKSNAAAESLFNRRFQ